MEMDVTNVEHDGQKRDDDIEKVEKSLDQTKTDAIAFDGVVITAGVGSRDLAADLGDG